MAYVSTRGRALIDRELYLVWSMHSLWANDLDPEVGDDDERAVSAA
ncbi:hypothetical protein ABT050_33530 [Streptomyces mirabilis]